jgi:hypothetical protein
MLPRSSCPQCGRSITSNKYGDLRSHFCPHYEICEKQTCAQCAEARKSGLRGDKNPTAVPKADAK